MTKMIDDIILSGIISDNFVKLTKNLTNILLFFNNDIFSIIQKVTLNKIFILKIDTAFLHSKITYTPK